MSELNFLSLKNRRKVNIDRVADSQKKKKAAKPEFACIGITDYCFFKCKMCDKWKEDIKVIKGTPRPNLENYRLFIDDLAELVKEDLKGHIDNRFTLNFAGGEALTHGMTIPLIRYAADKGFKTLVATNGYMLTEPMIKRLHEAGLTSLSISLDSIDPEIHDMMRGYKGATEAIMNALNILRKYTYPKVGICTVISRQSYQGIPKLISWAKRHDVVKWLYFMAVMQPNNTIFESGWYKYPEFNILWEDKSQKMIDTVDYIIEEKVKEDQLIKQEKQIFPLLTNTYPQLKAFRDYFENPEDFVKNNQPCNMDKGIQTTEVGDIFMCFHKKRMGNLREDRLIDIWSSGNTESIRQ
ncbi:radical SAM protein, partial [Candidatus Woesearchaeota archaeon]|nr:radical SAM protein [Candidatus Woesearchaeota archaeon]